MLHEVFYWVLNMSIIATVFGFLIYLIRLFKGVPKFGIYILWGIVLIRLVCPVGISSKYSLLSLLSKTISKTYVKTITIYNAANGVQSLPEISLSNMLQAATSYDPITYKTNLLEGFFKTAALVWIIVTISAILSVIIMYYFALSELKKATWLQDNIYESAMITTPTVYGIMKPKIVLPIGVNKEQLKYILLHEKIHIRRHDNIWRMLGILIACLHWFNPFIWLFLRCFFQDSELACDERAIKNMNSEEKKNYARTLLTYNTSEKTVFASAFGSSKVKVRINSVLSYKKLTLFSSIYFVGMLLMVVFILLTNAKG